MSSSMLAWKNATDTSYTARNLVPDLDAAMLMTARMAAKGGVEAFTSSLTYKLNSMATSLFRTSVLPSFLRYSSTHRALTRRPQACAAGTSR